MEKEMGEKKGKYLLCSLMDVFIIAIDIYNCNATRD
jgi:hypothetical protein